MAQNTDLIDYQGLSIFKDEYVDVELEKKLNSNDISTWAKAANKPTYTASEVGALPSNTTHLSGDIASNEKGAVNGVASLGSDGKIPAVQLPAYVDDVIEGYKDNSSTELLPVILVENSYNKGFIGKMSSHIYRFTANYTGTGTLSDYVEEIYKFPTTGETGKIYSDIFTNITYRWSGTQYTAIKGDLAIGETSTTAFAGNRGVALEEEVDAINEFGLVRATDDDIRALWA